MLAVPVQSVVPVRSAVLLPVLLPVAAVVVLLWLPVLVRICTFQVHGNVLGPCHHACIFGHDQRI